MFKKTNFFSDFNLFFQLEKLISKNYFLNLSAKEAYKAYVRAYDSHSLKHIFDVSTLDLVAVAKSFGFLVPPFVDLRMYLSLTDLLIYYFNFERTSLWLCFS